MEPLRILFVDDERSLLDGLRRSLHRKVKDWKAGICRQRSGSTGRDEEGPLRCHRVRHAHARYGWSTITRRNQRAVSPKTVRFVLSGFSDRQMILKSVGVTHQFFSKPCIPEHLVHAIEFSTSLYSHLNSSCVQEVICNIRNLPTPPVIYTEMTKELNSPEPSIEKLAELVKKDAAISARVLQMVNSAFFGIGPFCFRYRASHHVSRR